MSDFPLIEYINPDLEGLLERFFEVSRSDLSRMQAALDEEDFDTLSRLGHTTKGTGYGYGFTGMGDIGRTIEEAANERDGVTLQQQLSILKEYFDTVKIEFSEE